LIKIEVQYRSAVCPVDSSCHELASATLAQQVDTPDRRLMSFVPSIIYSRRPGDPRRWAEIKHAWIQNINFATYQIANTINR